MDEVTRGEPQTADDYSDRTTDAVKSVLLEIGQILGSYQGKFAVVGGAVPWLLLNDNEDMRHVGTTDIDLGLNAEALGEGQYARVRGHQRHRAQRRHQPGGDRGLLDTRAAGDEGPRPSWTLQAEGRL